MKKQLILSSFMLLFLGSLGLKAQHRSNSQTPTFGQSQNPECTVTEGSINPMVYESKSLFTSQESDTSKKIVPYNVIRCAPSLKYTIRKIGQGKKVIFSVNNGMKSFPKINFTQTSGSLYTDQKKQGFENVTFPFKCIINCSIDYTHNSFSNLATLINDFEVVINESGYWEISFQY